MKANKTLDVYCHGKHYALKSYLSKNSMENSIHHKLTEHIAEL